MIMNVSGTIVAAAIIAASALGVVASAGAATISSSKRLETSLAPAAETVQYRRGWRGGYRGNRIGAGIAAGVIIGGAIAASRPYGYYGYDGYAPDYAYSPGYYGQGYNSPYAGGDEVAYCQQRFRSYDPRSGTYLGYDGLRHPCP